MSYSLETKVWLTQHHVIVKKCPSVFYNIMMILPSVVFQIPLQLFSHIMYKNTLCLSCDSLVPKPHFSGEEPGYEAS